MFLGELLVGKINKSRINLKKLDEFIKAMNRKISIKVGIIGEVATQKHEGTDLTNAEIGAVHEFGATINHPGGTPYLIKKDGMAQFVSKSKGKDLPKTKPHTITIPARSFLREPILGKDGKKEILQVVKNEIGDYYEATDFSTANANKIIDEVVHLVAETALLQVQKSFYDDKIKPPTKPKSKKQRKYNPNNPTLIDRGDLLRSISYEIKEM